MSILPPGADAPNFDLTSTEGVVLMLGDEVPRSAVVLYFFSDPGAEGSRRDLLALSRHLPDWRELSVAVLGVSPAPLDDLKAVQADLKLNFPLLRDDRGFTRHYGVVAPEDGEAPPALFAVDRRQTIVWAASPVESVDAAVAEIGRALKRLPSSTQNYPRKATNRLVDLWVNQKSGLRKRRA